MKKIKFLFILFILSACTPQVTEISTVTSRPPTETPLPTPTLHPQFIELQNFINNSGERFTLLPDGTIEEATADGGRQTVPNLHVDQNGVINIIFNNEHVRIEQSQVTFDDESGLTIEGYELNENNEWVEVESSTIVNGLEIVLGDKVGEYTLITDFPYPDGYDSQAAMDKYDAMRESLQELFGVARWVLTPEENVALVNLETGTAYAAYERVSELYEKYDFIVDWNHVDYELLSNISVVFERDHNGKNIDKSAAKAASDILFNDNLKSVSLMGYEDYFGLTIGSTICTPNQRKCVFAVFSDLNRTVGESMRGVITILNLDGVNTSSFVAKNFVKDK